MAFVRDVDLATAAWELAGVAAECRTITDIQDHLLRALAVVVGADLALYHQVDLGGTFQEYVVPSAEPSDLIAAIRHYPPVSHDSPLVQHYTATGAPGVVSVRQMLSRRAWHENAVYRESFHLLDIQDHLAAMIGLRDGVAHGVTLTRSGHHPFTSDDCLLLEVLGRHLRAALRRGLESSKPYDVIRTIPTPVLTRRSGPAFSPAARTSALTPREQEVLALIADGLDTRQLARRLDIAPRTVEKHLEHAFVKLGAQNRLEAVAKSREAIDPF